MRHTVRGSGLVHKALTLVGGALALALGVMFSVVLLVVVVGVALVAWAYFWWRTRELRGALRERAPQNAGGGVVVEGEAVVVEEVRQSGGRLASPEAPGGNDAPREP